MRRTFAILCAVLCATLVLTGCQPPHRPPRTPAPPVFASEEAASEAAQKVLAVYLVGANRMAQSGGVDFSGYGDVLSDYQLADEQKDAAELQADGEHMVGDFATFGFHVEQFVDSNGSATLHARFCLDLTGVRVIDREGNDLSAENHRPATPWQAFLTSNGSEPSFIVKEVRRWEGQEFCLPD